jgi:hypothetical protein
VYVEEPASLRQTLVSRLSAVVGAVS